MMVEVPGLGIDRRSLVLGGAGLLSSALLPSGILAAAPSTHKFTITAAPARTPLIGGANPETEVWAYANRIPGPEIRVTQGDRVQVFVENKLPEETTVHWHGVRVPNAMDGVPHLTQQPIRPGETFRYDFVCPDAGTYWYHPHQRSYEQVGRGLYGPLIVEERQPLPVDRDVTWVLSDWRLLKDGSISNDFGRPHDVSHAGRIGNTVTVNGRVEENFSVRAGERVRLRLINAANARIFGLEFEDHAPKIIALDGQPVEPHDPEGNRIVLAPGMRADVVIDMVGQPAKQYRVVDRYYKGREYLFLNLAYSEENQLTNTLKSLPIELPSNALSELDLSKAERHEIVFAGGMMGGMRSAIVEGQQTDLQTLARQGLYWSINGVAATGHVHDPVITVRRGRTCLLQMINDTAWPHPMHLHGHAFRLLTRNGKPAKYREWLDTVLVSARERVEIAFVADNPGDWMFHCHVLEHDVGGMKSVIRVS